MSEAPLSAAPNPCLGCHLQTVTSLASPGIAGPVLGVGQRQPPWAGGAGQEGCVELARKGVPRDPAFLMRARFSSAPNRCMGRRLL